MAQVKKTGTFTTGGIEQGSTNKDAPSCSPSGTPLNLTNADCCSNTISSKPSGKGGSVDGKIKTLAGNNSETY